MPEEKIARKMTKGTSFILISRGTDGVISVVFSILIARMLTPDVYGLVGVSMGIAGIINLVGTLGISNAVTKRVSSHLAVNDTERLNAVLKATISLQLILGVISAVICYLMSDVLSNTIFQKPQLSVLLKALAIFVFTSAIVNWILAFFQGYHKMEYVAASDVLGICTRLGVAVSLVSLGFGALGAVMGFMVGSIVTAIAGTVLSIYLVLIKYPLKRHNARIGHPIVKNEMSSAIKYGLPMMASAAVVLVYDMTGSLSLLTITKSIADVSFFTIAFGIITIILVLPQSANASLLPIISGMHSRNDSAGISKTYQTSLKFLSYIINIIVFSLIVFSSQVIFILYGNSYLPALSPFLILASIGFIRPLSILSESVSAGMGYPEINTKANVFTAVLAAVFCIVLVPRYGIIGASIGILCAYSIGLGTLIYLVLKLSKTDFPITPILKSLVAGFLSAVVMLLLMKILMMLPFTSLIALIAYVAISFVIGATLYLTVLCRLKGFEKNEIKMIRNLDYPLSKTASEIISKLS